MDDDNAAAEIACLLQSPGPPPPQQPPPPPPAQTSVQEKTLEEVLESSTELIQTFAVTINQNMMREANHTEEFRREFKRRLIRAIVNTYIWATARLARETEMAEGRLAQDMQALLLAQREQERLRTRLVELVAAVSRAVEMFAEF